MKFKNLKSSITSILTLFAAPSLIAESENFRTYRNQNGQAYVEWQALDGRFYTLESSWDMEFWTIESNWIGYGQDISILVPEAPNNGGGTEALSQHDFSITTYSNRGSSLVSWTGADDAPYQVILGETYFSDGDLPFLASEITNPDEAYILLLKNVNFPYPHNSGSLTLSALPQAEQDHVSLLTSARPQILTELATNGGTTNQSGESTSSAGDSKFFRLIIARKDSDGDGLYDDIENTLGTNAFVKDTNGDGVTDPWGNSQTNFTDVIISEFMASNDATIADQFNKYPDYIELFNPTDELADLSGYYLSCDEDAADDLALALSKGEAWPIPAGVSLAPGQSLAIFASERNLNDPTAPMHTSFALKARGEDVVLIAPSGAVSEHNDWGKQRLNTSAGWGSDPETGLVSALNYFLEPTPGETNGVFSCSGLSEVPMFSRSGGIFSDIAQSVTIFPAENDDVIHYTLDGSNPTEGSPVYDGDPITIESTTVVRAIAVNSGCAPSPIATCSFLYKEDVIGTGGQGNPAVNHQVRPAHYPPFAIWRGRPLTVGNEEDPNDPIRNALLDYAMDPDVISQHYETIKSDLTEIPTIAISVDIDGLFGPRNGFYSRSSDTDGSNPFPDPLKRDWKRLASVEYIDPSDPSNYRQESCEITVSGGSTRWFGTTAKHNLRLIFSSKFSQIGFSRMEFGEPPFSDSPVVSLKQIQLRNPGHDSWASKWQGSAPSKVVAPRAVFLRDAWARKIHKAMNPAALGAENQGNWIAHRKWVHLYLNGLYWGLYDMTERIDDDFARYYGDSFADYDVMSEVGAKDGDSAAYLDLIKKCDKAWDAWEDWDASEPKDATDKDNKWKAVIDRLDLDNYIDYMIVNLYMANDDWPGNNWRAIGRRPKSPDTVIDEDNPHRFKFLVWDAEFGMASELLHTNIVNHPLAGQGAGEIHGILIDHPDYQAAFKNRVAVHFDTPGGAFSVDYFGKHKAVEYFEITMAELQPVERSRYAAGCLGAAWCGWGCFGLRSLLPG